MWYSFVHVARSRDYVPWTERFSHNVVSNLVTVCPNRSSVHRFLGLTSTKQGVNVTCPRPQRTAHRLGLEPGTPWSEIRRPNHCASPPRHVIIFMRLVAKQLSEHRKRRSESACAQSYQRICSTQIGLPL